MLCRCQLEAARMCIVSLTLRNTIGLTDTEYDVCKCGGDRWRRPCRSIYRGAAGPRGQKVVLIDDKLAWEKPCGGGITDKALARYSFLREAQVERNWVNECEFISPAGRRVCLDLDRPVAMFSRLVLNGLMLARARKAGAELLQERVTAVQGGPGKWQLAARSTQIDASHLVLAAGARSPFRAQFAQAFKAEDLMVTAGFCLRGSSSRMLIKFIPALPGTSGASRAATIFRSAFAERWVAEARWSCAACWRAFSRKNDSTWTASVFIPTCCRR